MKVTMMIGLVGLIMPAGQFYLLSMYSLETTQQLNIGLVLLVVLHEGILRLRT